MICVFLIFGLEWRLKKIKNVCGGPPLGKLLKWRAVSDGPLRGGLIAPKNIKLNTKHLT